MNEMDIKILIALKKNGRASLSDLALQLKVTRATIRTRMKNLIDKGDIIGFTVLTRQDVTTKAIRGLMMLEIEGYGAQVIRSKLLNLLQVQRVHTTNGAWDLIVELATESLEELDEILFKIRKFNGVKRSETSLLLSTK